MRIEITHRWRYQWGGRWVTSRWETTEQQIRKEHPEAVAVPGTRREKRQLDQPAEVDYANSCSQSQFARAPYPSVLYWPSNIPGHKGEIPLPAAVAEYSVLEVDGCWTVVQAGKHPREVYRGPGPVRVEAAP